MCGSPALERTSSKTSDEPPADWGQLAPRGLHKQRQQQQSTEPGSYLGSVPQSPTSTIASSSPGTVRSTPAVDDPDSTQRARVPRLIPMKSWAEVAKREGGKFLGRKTEQQ